MSYNIYPPIPWGPETPSPEGPSALPDAPPQVAYHLTMAQAKRQDLKVKEARRHLRRNMRSTVRY